MLNAVARAHNNRAWLRSYSNDLTASFGEVKTLLNDAFSRPSYPAGVRPHVDGCTSAASVKQVLEQHFDISRWESRVSSWGFRVSILNNCSDVNDVLLGNYIILCYCNRDLPLSRKLTSTYLDFGSIEDATYFCAVLKYDVSSWNSIISYCCKHGDVVRAFDIFEEMKMEEVIPDCATFVILLKVCPSFVEGNLLHAQLVEYVSVLNLYLESTLVDMYAKWGSLSDAYRLFENMTERNEVSWTIMIGGFVNAACHDEALELFGQMLASKLVPNEVTFSITLKGCTSVTDLDNLKKIHLCIVSHGFDTNLFVANALIDSYSKCTSLDDAHHVFSALRNGNVISWTSMIQAYAERCMEEETFKLFWLMKRKGVKPNNITLAVVLKLCAIKELLYLGKKIHEYIEKEKMEGVLFVDNCLLDMYVKCKDMKAAQLLFNEMWHRDVISWSIIIGGYAEYAQPHEAFDLFQKMLSKGVEPNEVTFIGLLQACASSAYLDKGKTIHNYIVRGSFEAHLYVENALIDMYCKSGSVRDAGDVFKRMSKRDLVSWNSLLAGYCQHGHTDEAFELFGRMTREPLKFDQLTFLSLLSACRHAGLVQEGRNYFNIMTKEHGIKPNPEHLACMVDLLGRAGCVNEALGMINKLSVDSIMVWMALLGACKLAGEVEVAEIATEHMMKLDPENTAACVMLSNIYAAAGRFGSRLKIEEGKEHEDEVSQVEGAPML